ncbi:MAG: hypothetical protein ACREIC_20110 [Limisphaerales bacterium]
MKRLVLVVIGLSVVVGLAVHLNRSKVQVTEAASSAEPAPPPASEGPQSAEAAVQTPEPPLPQPVRMPAPSTSSSQPAVSSAASALDASLVSRRVDVLVSPEATYQQKREAWKELRDSGKLDQAITDLEQRTASDPRSAEYPAALGQAYLQKCGTIHDVREQGILAMQADKVFDQALNLNPSNWEARFTKAVAMSYWPPMLNKGDEVIQNFQTLIQQQETQPQQQPQFAEPYAWLGDQYQKAGHTDDAKAIWQRGLALFPTDQKLQSKLAPAQ